MAKGMRMEGGGPRDRRLGGGQGQRETGGEGHGGALAPGSAAGARGPAGLGTLGRVPPVTVALLTVPRRVRRAEELTGHAVSHQRVEAQCLNAWGGHRAVPVSPASGPALPGVHVATACRWERVESGLCAPLV